MPHFASPDWSGTCGYISESNTTVTVSNAFQPTLEGRTTDITIFTVPRDGLVRLSVIVNPLIEGFTTEPVQVNTAALTYGINVAATSISGKTFSSRVFTVSDSNNYVGVNLAGREILANEICFHAKAGTTITLKFVVVQQADANGEPNTYDPGFTFKVLSKFHMD